MVKLFNNFILFLMPFLPKFLVFFIAGRYVAGETKEDALKVVKKLNSKGFVCTLDILGEHVTDPKVAEEITDKYIELYTLIATENLECNVSVKPSHIGLDISKDVLFKNLETLANKAKSNENFLRIDMESSKTTDVTIDMYKKLFKEYKNVGTVFQAYLYRTEADVAALYNPEFNFRLCKGIYKENPEIAIQDRQEINKNYLGVLRRLFQNDGYVAIATHDLHLLKQIYELINEMKVPSENFEFQVLYGVPMKDWLTRHLQNGYKTRVYVPFGPDWYDYSIRRIKENPNMINYIFANFFRKKSV